MTTARTKRKLVKITAWVPEHQMKQLLKVRGGAKNQSGVLRQLIEGELERRASLKAHQSLYNIATAHDFDDRVL